MAKTFLNILNDKAVTFSEIEKFNPYHDRLGRFSSAGGAAYFTIRTKDPKKQHMADMAIAREKDRNSAVTSNSAGERVASAQSALKSILREDAKVDLTGVDPDTAESITKSVKTVIERYPTVKDAFAGFEAVDSENMGEDGKGENTMASFNPNNQMIQLNRKYFGVSKAEFDKNYAKTVEDKFHPEGTTSDSVVVHEMGHAIDYYVSSKVIDSWKFTWGQERISSRLWNNDIKNAQKKGEPLTRGKIKEGLSGYGAKNAAEYIAEGFSEFMTSPNPRATAKSIGKRLETYIKKAAKE